MNSTEETTRKRLEPPKVTPLRSLNKTNRPRGTNNRLVKNQLPKKNEEVPKQEGIKLKQVKSLLEAVEGKLIED